MKLGDLVVRKSYGGDILFRIAKIKDDVAILTGVEFRLIADAPLSDLQRVEASEYESIHRGVYEQLAEAHQRLIQHKNQQREVRSQQGIPVQSADSFFEVPGKILQLDGDANYLNKSLEVYERLNLPAVGYHIPESQMPEKVRSLLEKERPDIVIITGHDGLLKKNGLGIEPLRNWNREEDDLTRYKNSIHFVNAVREARKYERNLDGLIIIAGACQSHFEALLQSGANFASSPARILIHSLDPVYIACKAAFTSIKESINIFDVITHTVSGLDGLGGVESSGSFRVGIPRVKA